jgi:hemolysin activation/secretion protein
MAQGVVPPAVVPQGVVPQYTPPTAAPPAPRFVLRELRFSPSALLDKADLEAIAKRYIGRELDIRDLQGLVAEVNALYQAKGMFTARAILPPQRIQDGIVNVDLVEGRLGTVQVSGNQYTKESYILSRVPLEPGAVIDGRRLERDLKWFNRTNDIALDATMKPGAAFGQSDLVLKVMEPPKYSLRLFADNEGIPSTGRAEAGLSFQDNALSGLGDSLSAYYTHSKGADNGSLSYKLPVTKRGGTLVVGYAQNTIAVNAGALAGLDVTAKSSTVFSTYTQPWLADDKWLVGTPITFSRTLSETMISGTRLSDFDVRKASGGISLDVRDPGYRATLLQTVAVVHSRNDSIGTDAERTVWNGNAGSVIRISDKYYAALRGGWQYSPQTDLPPSELFSIGGRATVRGYTRGFIAGKDGYYAGVEAHRLVTGNVNAFVFYDEGKVKTSNFPHQRIRGTGAGAVVTHKQLTMDFTAGYGLDRILPDQKRLEAVARVEISF